jgi:hypothetical protein
MRGLLRRKITKLIVDRNSFETAGFLPLKSKISNKKVVDAFASAPWFLEAWSGRLLT